MTFQLALCTPFAIVQSSDTTSASAGHAPMNVFKNRSVQVIQTTQVPQLPPLSLLSSLAQPSAMHTTQNITHTKTDIDIQYIGSNLDEVEEF